MAQGPFYPKWRILASEAHQAGMAPVLTEGQFKFFVTANDNDLPRDFDARLEEHFARQDFIAKITGRKPRY